MPPTDEGEELPQVEGFKYLRVLSTSDGKRDGQTGPQAGTGGSRNAVTTPDSSGEEGAEP